MVKTDTGGVLRTTISFVAVLVRPLLSVTVSLTVYVPDFVKV